MQADTPNGYSVQTIRSRNADGWKSEAVVTRLSDKAQVAIVRFDRIFTLDAEAQQHALDVAVVEASALAPDFENPVDLLVITR